MSTVMHGSIVAVTSGPPQEKKIYHWAWTCARLWNHVSRGHTLQDLKDDESDAMLTNP